MSTIKMSRGVELLANDIKNKYKLSDFESLSIALEVEKNEIIRSGLVVSDSDNHPCGLEAIAIALGYKQ